MFRFDLNNSIALNSQHTKKETNLFMCNLAGVDSFDMHILRKKKTEKKRVIHINKY